MQSDIAFDVDGVMADFAQAFIQYAKEHLGLDVESTDHFDFITTPHIDGNVLSSAIAEFIRQYGYRINPMSDGLILAEYVWNKTQKPLTFISARDRSTIQSTHNWLRKHLKGLPFVSINVEGGTDKIIYLSNFDTFVDDRRRTVLELAAYGKTVIMPIRAYNWPLPPNTPQRLLEKIIPVESLETITNGGFDHLLFKP
jgi:uncharacterized HAD superfamily protein